MQFDKQVMYIYFIGLVFIALLLTIAIMKGVGFLVIPLIIDIVIMGIGLGMYLDKCE